ncbi:MAG: 16S rRNA (cytidine(1402)-2'-O)-methyltransferase [Candidatus Moraniibacteriota bacterium]|nr:MAG: 16S rRNA (cytidine(1402)-2'-O)-methyltransferase [Candidatus Moranbacteria bacterium]
MEIKKGILYVVATPIGNLADMTFRAVDTLLSVDLIACEDTRVTRKLLAHYDINTHVITYHQHTNNSKLQRIIEEIRAGKNIAIVTDAGTPGMSDPGNKLVAEAITHEIEIVPIPGTSAVSTLISVAGIDMQKFTFMAYPPHKKGRKTFFEKVCASEVPIIYYESVHRILKNLSMLSEMDKNIKIIVGKELTKIHEQIIRGSVDEILKYFEENPDKVRGEFVIIAYR